MAWVASVSRRHAAASGLETYFARLWPDKSQEITAELHRVLLVNQHMFFGVRAALDAAVPLEKLRRAWPPLRGLFLYTTGAMALHHP